MIQFVSRGRISDYTFDSCPSIEDSRGVTKVLIDLGGNNLVRERTVLITPP